MSYHDIDPMDLDPETGRPYSNYSSPSLDTSFEDGERVTYTDEFSVGDVVIWPNGTQSRVRGIDTIDDTLMREDGTWFPAYEVSAAA